MSDTDRLHRAFEVRPSGAMAQVIEGMPGYRFSARVFYTALRFPSRNPLVVAPQTLFRPEGIFVWGAYPGTRITSLTASGRERWNTPRLAVNEHRSLTPFDDFERLYCFDGERQSCAGKPWIQCFLRQVPGAQQFKLPTLIVSEQLSITVEGPFTEIVAWGMGCD